MIENPTTDNFAATLDLIQAREAWSNERLADELEITTRQLQRWRNGEARPPVQRAARLAQKFGMTVGEFLGLEVAP
jgi:transcriptional regulator with XRE-family HTH domain